MALAITLSDCGQKLIADAEPQGTSLFSLSERIGKQYDELFESIGGPVGSIWRPEELTPPLLMSVMPALLARELRFDIRGYGARLSSCSECNALIEPKHDELIRLLYHVESAEWNGDHNRGLLQMACSLETHNGDVFASGKYTFAVTKVF